MRIASILVAAGSGSRFGTATPKQFLALGDRSVLRHAAEALAPYSDLLQPVGDAGAIGAALAGIDHLPVAAGGADRQASVLAGLEALAAAGGPAPDIVLIHDGARPAVPPGTVAALLEALAEAPGAIPALPVADTLKYCDSGRIIRTVPRAGFFRAQTPQGFRFALLLELHRRAAGSSATDDAFLLEAAGHEVRLVAGSEDNIKVTYPEDLARLERRLAGPMLPRIGTGFDVHALQAGRPLVLCGVTIPHERGLAGHSDADVAIHALCDALYGALAEGDIGRHFPPSEAEWKDCDSARFLSHAIGRVRARGGLLANADVTLICERPRITPHAPAMIARLAQIMAVDTGRISVKATTTERLGFTGRGEGIAAQAAVAIMLPVTC